MDTNDWFVLWVIVCAVVWGVASVFVIDLLGKLFPGDIGDG